MYAFSIENFKRDPEEVEFLMNLASSRLKQLSKERYLKILLSLVVAAFMLCPPHSELIHKHKVRINVLGKISLLSETLQVAVAEAHEATKDYDQ